MAAQHFGTYVLEHRVASGGMADVWRARSATGAVVALKRALPHLAENPHFVELMLTEARIVQQLDHPNVVRVFDSGLVDGVPFLAMEFIEGVDLGSLLKKAARAFSKVPPAVALRIGHDVCRALDYANHAKSHSGERLYVVHRDVSPHNVMVKPDGCVTLLDFGIVKAADTALTEPGMVKGKFAFMSPEQAAGEPVDARSDLFSLALVLYEMLSGKRPYQRDSELGAYQAAVAGIVPPISTVWPQVPADLEAVLTRALARDRDERFSSGAELAEALSQTVMLADDQTVAGWASSVGSNRPTLVPDDDPSPYPSDKALDPSGQLLAPSRATTDADFKAPDFGSLDLARHVQARSSVELPKATGRPAVVLQPVNRLELPPENRAKPAKLPVVLPTLAATPVAASSDGVPVKLVAGIVAAIFVVGAAVAVAASRHNSSSRLVVAPVSEATTPPPARVKDAGLDDIDPATGMRRSLPAVKLAGPDHLARDHSELEPVRYLIDSVPPGATLTINGEVVGVTPWGGDNDPVRGAVISATLKGYAPWSVKIAPGDDYATTIKFKR